MNLDTAFWQDISTRRLRQMKITKGQKEVLVIYRARVKVSSGVYEPALTPKLSLGWCLYLLYPLLGIFISWSVFFALPIRHYKYLRLKYVKKNRARNGITTNIMCEFSLSLIQPGFQTDHTSFITAFIGPRGHLTNM